MMKKHSVKPAKNKKTAFITGITGQDGSYLAEHLLELGYNVWGFERRSSLNPRLRLGTLERDGKVKMVYGDLRDYGAIMRALELSKPDEIYNLAAQSDVWASFKVPEETMEINYHGVGRLVHAAMQVNPKVRIYQASTSEMFGSALPPQNEKTPFAPVSPYAVAKLRAHEDYVVGYRERHGLYICSGILFNHESPRRGEKFVTRKITIALANIKHGKQEFLELGNLEAKRDWGFAGDYVKLMHRMLQEDKPDDYVIATGKTHTVREFFVAAAKAAGFTVTWHGKGLKEVAKDQHGRTILKINKEFYRPNEVHYLLGDAGKAKRKLGWKPETSFEQLVEMMVAADIERYK